MTKRMMNIWALFAGSQMEEDGIYFKAWGEWWRNNNQADTEAALVNHFKLLFSSDNGTGPIMNGTEWGCISQEKVLWLQRRFEELDKEKTPGLFGFLYEYLDIVENLTWSELLVSSI